MIRARRAVGIMILLISLVVLLWAIWPQATAVRAFPVVIALDVLSTSDVASTTSFSSNWPIEKIMTPVISPYISLSSPPSMSVTPSITSIPPGNSENRSVVLEWPLRLRVGDADFLSLKLVVAQQRNTSSMSDTADNETGNETYEYPNSPAIHNIIIEARLDIAGMQYTPSEEISESLHPGEPVMFLWSVRAPEVGTYRGTVWLHVRFVPPAGEAVIRKVLSAPRVEIKANNFLGLSGTAARILGSVGVMVGSTLGLDGFLSWFWNYFKSLSKSSSDR